MKSKTIYVCKECGAHSAAWAGKCHSCGTWDSFTEETISKSSSGSSALISRKNNTPVKLSDIASDKEFRLTSKLKELDRVLGGGIIPGSLVLIGGDPGIGKSTLMLQMSAGLSEYMPLYITGEESLKQIKYRSDRMKGIPDNLLLMAETNIENIIAVIEKSDSKVVIIDSIQSVFSEKIDAAPGSVAQVRESTAILMQTAKRTSKAIFIIGHVTKDGMIAGPKMLEHMVDTVIQFEGEKTYSYRILRSHKNRFGSTNEIGIFEMSDKGLREVSNPSELFLVQRRQQDSGIAIVASLEGSRPILLEVQALVTPTGYSVPQRTATGFDMKRLQMILAVLEKRLGLQFVRHDVFINVAGGVRLNDPSVDLGIAAALVSSLKDQPVKGSSVLIGEIGLTGEIRAVSSIDQRIKEAQKLGFENVIIPEANYKKIPTNYGIGIKTVERISLAFSELF